jgi:hypothetical protein
MVCHAVIKSFNFQLREISKYISITKAAAYDATHDSGGKYKFIFPEGKTKQFLLLCLVPIIIGLRLGDGKKYNDFINGLDSSALWSVCKNLDHHLFEGLLSDKETHGESVGDCLHIDYEKRICELYDAIFMHTYTDIERYKKIGEYIFSESTKKELCNIANLFSEFSSYNN